MRFMHLSDLHIGKRVNGFSMLDDQRYILDEIIKIVKQEKTDAVFIAGDIYDKAIPPAEAVELLDDFLFKLSKSTKDIFIISGNHDSAERISFGGRLMERNGVHISPVYKKGIKPVKLIDKYGEINIYMLPFIKPVNVRLELDTEIVSYNDMMKKAIENMDIDKSKRNILLSHQFVTGAVRSESEDISVGGLDNIDSSVYDDFDYVALGHIHSSQSIGRKEVRYCGTPLKYSFSECKHTKTVTIAEAAEKGNVKIKEIELKPIRDMAEIRGRYEEIISKDYIKKLNTENYFHVTLTDEEEIINAVSNLQKIYPNIMKLDYDNSRTRYNNSINSLKENKKLSPIELFCELFRMQNNSEIINEQREYLDGIIEEIWGDEA